jgi:hypothetical protein
MTTGHALLVTLPAALLLAATPLLPLAYRPPLYGLAIFLAACAAWPASRSDDYRHRLRFLRRADGFLPTANYFLFAAAASLLVMTVAGFVLYL